MTLIVAREVCRDFDASSRLEWLETDGLGGFAMGTAAGVNTRRYHGVLVVARSPPGDRAVLLSKLEETVTFGGAACDLATAQYPGVVHPEGYRALESFRVEPFPTWTWAFDGASIEKDLFVVRGEPTAIVRYRASRECRLRVRPFLAYRDFHALGRASDPLDGRFVEERRPDGVATLRLSPRPGLPSLRLHHRGTATPDGAAWYYRAEYLVELERGLDFREDLYCIGAIDVTLSPERPAWLVASTVEATWDEARVAAAAAAERARRRTTGSFASRLAVAAEAFSVRRADGTPTVVAGYPWFADWGRDTMISLPGLLLARGRIDEAREVIDGFLARADRGLVPNRFADSGQAPEYNTVDATLWMFHAVDAYLRAGGDRRWAREVFYPKGREIIDWHERGTLHGIGVDPADGLLVGGGPGTQLTWMDAKVADRVVTPRHGKAVEINALWFNALRVMESLALEVHDVEGIARFASAAQRAGESFARGFWNEERGCLFDVLLPDGPDARMRPNQIFAVSLPYRALSLDRQRRVVRAVERDLLTPVGLRTLAPGEAGYRPRYAGDPAARDGAYHQGVVWPWLLGPFVTATLNAFGRDRAQLEHAASLVRGVEERALREGVLGQIGELFDAEPPYRPGGAPAQAWSVAAIAEVVRAIERELGTER